MKKDDTEFLILDDNDDFEEDFMLNNKKSKKEEPIIEKKVAKEEIETLSLDEELPKKKHKEVKEEIETLEFEEISKKKVKEDIVEKLELDEPVKKKINPDETIDLIELDVPRRRSKEEPDKILKHQEKEAIKETKVEEKKKDKDEIKEEIKENIPSKTKKEKKAKQEKPKKEKKMKKEKKTKKKLKKSVFISMLVFDLISIAFILGCCIYYGSRMIHYYKIYNPKSESGESITLIASSLTSGVAYQTEGEGLYRLNGASIYKGKDVKNYVKFSNMIWRIISINTDGSIELVLDEPINVLMYDVDKVSYDKSDVNSYLNEVFIKYLNIDYLSKTPFCLDEIEDIQAIKCTNNSTDYYVRLLSISEFVRSFADNKSYLLSDYNYWLYNNSQDKAWHTSGESVSLSSVTDTYYVKPVIKLSNTNILVSGDGTIENPYQVEKTIDKYSIGSYVKLGEDKWVIYASDDKTINLALEGSLTSLKKFSSYSQSYDVTDTTSVAYYLNNTYLESLSYKNIINDYKWSVGLYDNSYKNIDSTKVEAKVGMLSVSDLKIGNIDKMYYTLSPAKTGYVYYFDGDLIASKVSFSRNIKPTININKLKITSGSGSQSDPYILEMEA